MREEESGSDQQNYLITLGGMESNKLSAGLAIKAVMNSKPNFYH